MKHWADGILTRPGRWMFRAAVAGVLIGLVLGFLSACADLTGDTLNFDTGVYAQDIDQAPPLELTFDYAGAHVVSVAPVLEEDDGRDLWAEVKAFLDTPIGWVAEKIVGLAIGIWA
ncbi:MAG: hypothetical protein AAF661_05130 [Pseudomonadota bacterium]